MLVEYEEAEAHLISFKFSSKSERIKFDKIAKQESALDALRSIHRHAEARRVILNSITVAMVSDCAHHIYEALRCFEKRKFIPAFNLLRKPLLDNLTYISWMVGDEDGFYEAFTSGDPKKLTQKVIGNYRKEIFSAAAEKSGIADIFPADYINSILFESSNEEGLYLLFQHAVHLITVDRIELRTSPENFNFIFKSPADNDIYEILYRYLPAVLLYLTHLILELYQRIKPMDPGSVAALNFRCDTAYSFLLSKEFVKKTLEKSINSTGLTISCNFCNTILKFTHHNTARILMTDSFRCTHCGRVSPLPLSWMF